MCVDVKLAVVDAIPHGTLLEATVTNVGPYPVGKVQVVWHGRWDVPSDSGLIGRGLHFVPVGGPLAQELRQAESQRFALTEPLLQQGLSYAASLDPDQFHLAVEATLTGQYMYCEIARVTGPDLGFWIEKLEEFLETEGPQ
jgi:hypothetical protein